MARIKGHMRRGRNGKRHYVQAHYRSHGAGALVVVVIIAILLFVLSR